MNLPASSIEWFREQLITNGFSANKLTLQLGKLLPIGLSSESRKSKDYWSGLYHLFKYENKIALYAYNSENGEAYFIASKFDYPDSQLTSPLQEDIKTEDEILKQSRKEALSSPEFEKEKQKVQNFINNKNAKGLTEQDFNRIHSTEKQKNIQAVYDNAQVLEDTLCSYSALFMGISDADLQAVRVVDCNIEVQDCYENPLYLKKGDILIKYESNPDLEASYVVKSNANSNQFIENKIVDDPSNANFKIFGGDLNNDKWVFVATDFLSANAIFHATNVKTIVAADVSSLNKIYNFIHQSLPEAKICVYRNDQLAMRDSYAEFILKEAERSIFNAYLDQSFANWCDYRKHLIENDGEKGIVKFKEKLLDAFKVAKHYSSK